MNLHLPVYSLQLERKSTDCCALSELMNVELKWMVDINCGSLKNKADNFQHIFFAVFFFAFLTDGY